MKKTLLLLASAALLLVGCAKEKLGPDAGSGEMVTANFTAQMQGMPQTKSVTDGEGTEANRCVMEIYYKGVLYTRDVQPITGMKATFTPKLVSNRTYDVLFWADCGEDLADKYYTTDAEGLGLQAVEMKATAYAANDDARDAFYTTESVPVGQQVSSKTFTLTRPFAQVNIITTDAAIIKNDNLYPDGVKMVYKAPTKFNLLTETLSEEKELTVTGAPYEALDTTSVALTLEMDYLFTGEDKSALDIAFEASRTGESTVTSHSFTNIPVQRNYRTNIKGALLTTTGDWTATIAPAWTTPAYDVPFLAASTIAEAQSYIAPTTGGTQASKVVDLSKATIKTTDIKGDDKKIEFRLKTTSPADMVSFTLPEIPQDVLEVGCTGWKITYDDGYPTQNVNVTAPTGTNVTIEAPISHVTLNGEVYNQVTATTGTKTLVVPAGVTVKNLIVKKGAVEIHGVVDALEITPADSAKVCFRACEGLSAAVFAKIYKESENINYIDPMYAYEQVDGKYNIYKLPVVAMIGEDEYPSLASAINAVKDNDIIVLTKEVENAVGLKVNTGKTFTVDFNGHTYTLNKPGAGSAGTEANAFQLLQGQKVTFKNGKIEVSPDNLTPATVGKNIKRLIQGYAELVLEDMVLDATNLYESNAQYVCSFNNQPVTLKGNTSIIGLREGFTAFDSDGNWDGYARCQVTIDTKGTIAGPIELGQGFIEIKDVVLLGAINLCTSCGASETEGQLDRITIKGGTFSVDPSAYVKSPYEVKENGDGTFSVVKGSLVMPTRPVYKYEESEVLSTQEELKNAIEAANAGDIIYVGSGTYSLPGISKNISVRAANNAVVTITTGTGNIASIPAGCTFDGLTFEMGKSNYHGFQHAGHIKMDFCTINGLFFSYGNMTFYGCTFNQSIEEYSMWCYAGDCSYDYCTFNNNGKFLNAYNEGNTNNHWNVSMTNCRLSSTKKNKAVINIKETCVNGAELSFHVNIDNCEIVDETMFPSASGSISEGTLYVGGPLFQVDDRSASTISKSMAGNGIIVTLDGAVVYGKKAE